MDEETAEEHISAKPYLTRIRLALAPYTVHFHNPGYIKDETMRMLERDVVKTTLEETRRNFELRYVNLQHDASVYDLA
jgi:palmitoyltransferase